MNCHIAPIGENYIEGFRQAVDRVARERKYLCFLEAPPLEETRKFVRDIIANGDVQLVALHGDKVIGWCDVIRDRSRPAYMHKGTLGMGVLPECRGRGVGRALMRDTLAAAFALPDMLRVELTVWTNNERAIALYKKCGFQIEGLHREVIRIDGRCEDDYSMALLRREWIPAQ